MEIFDVNYALEHLTILVDTRERDTPKLRKRLKAMELPHERKKLDFGDYSIKCKLPDGEEITFQDIVAIERKHDISELATNFCSRDGERTRFTREFNRAKEKGAKLYLLIENASWDIAYSGDYRSQMAPKALVGSMQAWQARYNCSIIFCSSNLSGKLIANVLKKEVEERLEQNAELCG